MAEGHADPNISDVAHLEQMLKGNKSLQAKAGGNRRDWQH